jgi:glutaredoxin
MYEQEVMNRIPILLAISTCPRCERVKKFLKLYQITAKIIDVDLLPIEEKRTHMRFLQPFNPRLSFPTLIIGDFAVVGEDYDGIKEVLGL